MPEYLSIKERIGQRLEAIALAGLTAAIAEEVTAGRLTLDEVEPLVQRWDVYDNPTEHLSLLQIEEEVEDEFPGEGMAGDVTVQKLMVRWELLVAQTRGASERSTVVFNRWLARMQSWVFADRNLIEPVTDAMLCTDISPAGSNNPPGDKEQGEFFVILDFEVQYDLHVSNPYTAPAVTAKEA